MKKLVISALMASLLAACASQKPAEKPVAETKMDTTTAAEKTSEPAEHPPATAATAGGVETRVDVDNLNKDKLLLIRSTYYPFDVYVVQDADKPAVQAHAKYLSEHPNRNVRLEGNCDERGSNEYNLGLGQRRADGVKKMLEVGGAKDNQIETASFGEEKPKATGHDEASWAQNRRTDLNYNVR